MSNFSDLDDETKIEELRSKIIDLAKIDAPLEIRCGYPPKVLAALDDDTLKKCGISSGGEKLKKFMQSAIDLTVFFFFIYRDFDC